MKRTSFFLAAATLATGMLSANAQVIAEPPPLSLADAVRVIGLVFVVGAVGFAGLHLIRRIVFRHTQKQATGTCQSLQHSVPICPPRNDAGEP